MAPIHHHFEQKGWKETQVVVRFWIITIVLVLVGLSTLKSVKRFSGSLIRLKRGYLKADTVGCCEAETLFKGI